MPPRRKPPKKSQAPASRVHKIGSREQWDAMLKKAGDKRLVIVQFFQASVWTCKQMRPYFVRFSIQPKFRKAIFAEVDADMCEDLARYAGINRIPTYQAYWNGQEVDSYEGGAVDKLSEFIAANLAEYSPSGGPLAVALKLVAAAALVAGGTLLATRLGGGNGGNSSGMTPAEQILDLKQRIMNAQGRLRNCERANKGKQARAQRKLIEQLTAQVRQLEKKDGIKAAAGAAGGKGGEKSGEKGSGSGEGKEGGSDSGKAPRKGPALSLEELARLRRRRVRGEVLYSDEEDAIEVADSVAGW